MAASTALLVPIGHCIGALYDDAVTDGANHVFQIRIGPDLVRLGDVEFAVWALAHGTPDRALDQHWDRAAVLHAAARAGLPGADAVLDALLADHVLFEVAPGPEAAVDFARRFRLLPLMLGLGNTAEEPRLYSVGLIGRPIVSMSAAAYDLYEWAHLENDLWLACQGAAATASGVGITDPDVTDPHRMLSGLLSTLHSLLAPNAVYLDTRLAGEAEHAAAGGPG